MAKTPSEQTAAAHTMDRHNPDMALTDFGFRWGPMEVTRAASWPQHAKTKISRALRIHTPKQFVDIVVSPSGNSVRVFRNGVELVEPTQGTTRGEKS